MKKLCATQNRRAKQWAFSQSVRKVAKFAMRNFANQGAISHCEISQTRVPFRIAKFRKPGCHFAMRNFANHFDAFVRQMNSVLWLQNFRNAKFAMRSWQTTFRNAKWLRTVCEQFAKIPVLFFSLLIFNICSKICTKRLKLKQEKFHKGTN